MRIGEGGAPVYKWEEFPLSNRQKLYAHLDVATPLRLLLQYALKVAELEKLTPHHDQLSDLLDDALRFAAKSKSATYNGLEPLNSKTVDTDEDCLMIVTEHESSEGPSPTKKTPSEERPQADEPMQPESDKDKGENDDDSYKTANRVPVIPRLLKKTTSRINDRLLSIASGSEPEKPIPPLGKRDEEWEKTRRDQCRKERERSADRRHSRRDENSEERKRSKDKKSDRRRSRSRDRESSRSDRKSSDRKRTFKEP